MLSQRRHLHRCVNPRWQSQRAPMSLHSSAVMRPAFKSACAFLMSSEVSGVDGSGVGVGGGGGVGVGVGLVGVGVGLGVGLGVGDGF